MSTRGNIAAGSINGYQRGVSDSVAPPDSTQTYSFTVSGLAVEACRVEEVPGAADTSYGCLPAELPRQDVDPCFAPTAQLPDHTPTSPEILDPNSQYYVYVGEGECVEVKVRIPEGRHADLRVTIQEPLYFTEATYDMEVDQGEKIIEACGPTTLIIENKGPDQVEVSREFYAPPSEKSVAGDFFSEVEARAECIRSSPLRPVYVTAVTY